MLGDTRSRVAVLEQRTEDQQRLFEKVDTAIQVMQEAVASVTQMLAVHNERLEQHSKTETLLVEMIKEVKTNLEAENVDLSDQIHEIDQRVDELKKLQVDGGWYCFGNWVCVFRPGISRVWLVDTQRN